MESLVCFRHFSLLRLIRASLERKRGGLEEANKAGTRLLIFRYSGERLIPGFLELVGGVFPHSCVPAEAGGEERGERRDGY